MGKLLNLLLLFTFISCQSESRSQNALPRAVELVTPMGEVIKTTLAITHSEQQQGLSGVKSSDFNDNEGMLFIYPDENEKNFWMPDTYFDLDIIYLDKNLQIVDIVRKLPHYVGRANPNLIPRARPVWSRHALEMKASSKISKNLKVGDTLKWKGEIGLEELNQKIKENLGSQL